MTLPAGLAGGRPSAVRLVAPPLEEARLLSAAALFQARTSHHLLRPPGPAPQVADLSPDLLRPAKRGWGGGVTRR